MVHDAIAHFSPVTFAYALLSLTFIRILPVALSLLGTGLRVPGVRADSGILLDDVTQSSFIEEPS